MCVSVLKSYFNHCFCRFTKFYNGGRNARSLLSLFVDPERILRRLYVFAEEPCKSTITISEPCSPVFKEAQPRPFEQSISLISRIGIFIIVHNVFLLLVIYCCNKASNRIVTRSKELVFYSWIPLPPEVSRLSPYTHTHDNIRELQEPSTHLRYTNQTTNNYPFNHPGENSLPDSDDMTLQTEAWSQGC